MCRDPSSDAADQPAQPMPSPKCRGTQIIENHDAIRGLPDGVFGYPGSGSQNFAGVDAIIQPDLLYQITVSQKHGINSHGLLTAANNLRSGAAYAELAFAVPTTAFSHAPGSSMPQQLGIDQT